MYFFSTKLFPALQVRSIKKLLKKGQKKLHVHVIPTSHLNWKTALHQQFPSSILEFLHLFYKLKKKNI